MRKMFSIIRTGVLLTGLQRASSQKAGTGLNASLISNLAKNTFAMQSNYSTKNPDKAIPISKEEYVRTNMPSFDEYCQKIALPLINRSCADPEKAKRLSAPSHLQKAYEGYCAGCYRGYVNSLDPMNPFILKPVNAAILLHLPTKPPNISQISALMNKLISCHLLRAFYIPA